MNGMNTDETLNLSTKYTKSTKESKSPFEKLDLLFLVKLKA